MTPSGHNWVQGQGSGPRLASKDDDEEDVSPTIDVPACLLSAGLAGKWISRFTFCSTTDNYRLFRAPTVHPAPANNMLTHNFHCLQTFDAMVRSHRVVTPPDHNADFHQGQQSRENQEKGKAQCERS
jgi:hypothetical protein